MRRLGFAVALLAVALDQATKLAILHWVMTPPRAIEVTSFFDIVLVWNRGASFGLLNTDAAWVPWLFALLNIAITTALIVWLWRTHTPLLAVALGLVIGGAIGNLIDRMSYGAVVDFLLFDLQFMLWPAFNVADSAIAVGVALILYDGLKGSPRVVT